MVQTKRTYVIVLGICIAVLAACLIIPKVKESRSVTHLKTAEEAAELLDGVMLLPDIDADEIGAFAGQVFYDSYARKNMTGCDLQYKLRSGKTLQLGASFHTQKIGEMQIFESISSVERNGVMYYYMYGSDSEANFCTVMFESGGSTYNAQLRQAKELQADGMLDELIGLFAPR